MSEPDSISALSAIVDRLSVLMRAKKTKAVTDEIRATCREAHRLGFSIEAINCILRPLEHVPRSLQQLVGTYRLALASFGATPLGQAARERAEAAAARGVDRLKRNINLGA